MHISFLIKQSEKKFEMQLSLAQLVTSLATDKCMGREFNPGLVI